MTNDGRLFHARAAATRKARSLIVLRRIILEQRPPLTNSNANADFASCRRQPRDLYVGHSGRLVCAVKTPEDEGRQLESDPLRNSEPVEFLESSGVTWSKSKQLKDKSQQFKSDLLSSLKRHTILTTLATMWCQSLLSSEALMSSIGLILSFKQVHKLSRIDISVFGVPSLSCRPLFLLPPDFQDHAVSLHVLGSSVAVAE